MSNRDKLVNLAKDTIEISKKGQYVIGNRVYNFNTDNNTVVFRNFERIKAEVAKKPRKANCNIQVRQEGTVDAIFRLSRGKQTNLALGVLNFASAYNPGGGFETGAMAQEECLAYCSDLYKKQVEGAWEYYEINRAQRNPLYTDTMFMTDTTFFRDGSFNLVANPTLCNVLTCPAVNMGAIKDRSAESLNKAKAIMKNRMRKILFLFAFYECTDIVLGAYGCGVFGNDPYDVAQFWHELLVDEGMWSYFDSITFSILGGKSDNIKAFNQIFN